MTDLKVRGIRDAMVREARPGLPDASGDWIRVNNTTPNGRMRGYLLPELGNSVTDRTVLSEVLSGRVAPGWVAQTITVAPITSKWSPGRVTWDDQPTVDATRQVAIAVPALPDGGIVELPLDGMIADVAAGTDWWGVRITTNSTAASQRFYATNSGEEDTWVLDIVLSDAPEQATNLRPSGGGSVVASKPTLAWDFLDLGGDSTAQADSWIQVDTPAAGADPDEVAPDYNSGWVPNLLPHWNLAAPPAGAPAYAGMPAAPTKTYWRVINRDGDGNIPRDVDGNLLWSDWAEVGGYLPHGVLVMDSPTGTFGDPTPQVLAHLTVRNVKWWSALVTGPDKSDVRYELGRTTGPIDFTVPRRNDDGVRVIKESEGGWLYLRVRDTEQRAVAVGEKTYVDVWVPLNLSSDPAALAPTNLTVAPVSAGDFRNRWTWQRTEAADAWLPEIDGDSFDRLDPELVTEGPPGTYAWIDNGEIPPFRTVDLGIRAAESGNVTSLPATTTGHRHEVASVWLLLDGEQPIRVRGKVTPDQVTRDDRVATYVPLDGPEVDILYGSPGRVGRLEGTLDFRQPIWRDLKALERARKGRGKKRIGRVIYAAESARVRLRSIDYGPHDLFTPDNLMHFVRFGIVELDD